MAKFLRIFLSIALLAAVVWFADWTAIWKVLREVEGLSTAEAAAALRV